MSQEKQKIVLDQHLSVIGLDSVNLASNPYPFYQLLEKYDYAILKQSSEELSKLLKNWYRNFEKALMESFKEDWKLDQYSVSNISNVDACQKLIKIMKDRLDEKQVSKFLREPKLGFKLYLPIYTTYLEEGLDDIVLETLNGNIEEIKVSLNRLGSKFLVKKDLDLIEKFVEKIEDSERKEFAKILFYRIGTKNTNGTKSLELFATSLKEMVKQPIKDAGIKRKLLELLSGTELMSDKDLIEMLNDSNEKFDENKLKTATYQEIGVSFRIYCRKFSKILVDEGLEKLKSEVDKTLANIQENSGNKDGFILAISDSLADDLRSDKNIIKNANVYREAIFYVLDSFGHAGDNGKLGFNYALCLLFLDNKGDQYSDIIDRYNKQHVFHWEKKLSTVEAIQLFKTAYLQNPEQSASILKSLNEFLNSKANDYYDFLSDDKAQNLFDFITTESDKKTVLESYKLFNQKEKAKQ